MTRAQKMKKTGDRAYAAEEALYAFVLDQLEKNVAVRNMELLPEQKDILKDLFLLTAKPVIYAANISEDDISKPAGDIPMLNDLNAYAKKENSEVLIVSAKVEEELSELNEEEKQLFFEDLGIAESGLDRLVKTSYKLLGLISFLTAGPKEVRAWTIKKGTKAPQAAGTIHTDFERGFIKAEVVAFDTLREQGGMHAAKEKGLVRQEGKDYVMKDGDVVLFKFNV